MNRRWKKKAVIRCTGGCKVNRDGEEKCQWGCIGCMACERACRFGAIKRNENGTPYVDWELCTGCGMCIKVCPKELIKKVSVENPIFPACVSQEKGAQTAKICETGCIGCGICVRNCPADAIYIQDGHAVMDEEKCIACGMCAVKCPKGVIQDQNGIF